MATTYSTVFGTLPNVTSLLGEDTLAISYPTSIVAGDILAMVVVGTTAGSTNPSADGLWTGAVWNVVTSGTVRYYWPPVKVAAGGESGTVTITKGSALSRLVGAIIIKFDAFAYDAHTNIANDVQTNHNGNPASGGSPLSNASLDDGTILAGVPLVTQPRRTYTIWYWSNAGNSGSPVTETFAGPDTEVLLVSTQKDEEGNPSNANTRDRFLRASELTSWAADTPISSLVDTETDTSGFANPNQALLSTLALRFAFSNTPPEVVTASGSLLDLHVERIYPRPLPYELGRNFLRD